ncbi:MAG: TRAP transporter large permease subunit [Gammaproteobacteria bacterium]|jgi:C4-dicarboxylate transporter DctM subunit
MVYGLVLLILALLSAPLFAIIAASALFGFHAEDIDLQAVVLEFYRISQMPILVAIPLFTFAGYLLGESNAPRRLVRLTRSLLGWMPGGLPIVSLVSCALFTAFTGASGITIVALGALLYPALVAAGYSERFGLGLVTSSGSLGLLFAPSLPLILYGVVAQQLGIGAPVNINQLFIAGLGPGLLMLVLLSIYSIWQRPRQALDDEDKPAIRESLRESAWELPLPVVILGGIYGGFIGVSEAAAVTALYVFVVEVLIKREIAWHDLPRVMRESMIMVGGILIILGMSLASTNYLIDAEVPTHIFHFISQHIDSRLTFLVLLNIFLLVLGTMLDIFSALVIMVPILLPVALQYGINPLHLGIIFLANMQIGYFTPPVGMNLFIASYRFDEPVLKLYRATLPYFFILLAAVLIITYWPDLSLAPVRWLTH